MKKYLPPLAFLGFMAMLIVGSLALSRYYTRLNNASCPAGYIEIVDYKGSGCVFGFRD